MNNAAKFFLIILILGIISDARAASVHGSIYTWSDFEKPIKNTIVEINSVPVQSKVANEGTYSFDNLIPGNYTIKARFYHDNILEYTSDEDVRIVDMAGAYNIDILLFPPTESEYEYLGDINLSSTIDVKDEGGINTLYVLPGILLVLAAVTFYFIRKKKKVSAQSVNGPSGPEQVFFSVNDRKQLPDDLKKLYDLILADGGRITQKDIRKKISCSEAKVSLMLDDLEDRGLIKKIKKGRSNIIIAEQEK